jgi:hypothetical protein
VIGPGRTASPTHRWRLRVTLGTAAAATVAAEFGGVAGLGVAIAAIGATLSDDLRGLVRRRSRELHGAIDARLGDVQTEHADAAVQAGSHGPFAFVKQLLGHYRPPNAAAQRSLQAVDDALDAVLLRLRASHARRLLWASTGAPELIGGLATTSRGLTVKYYGDPVNLPRSLRGRRARPVALQIGRVLDDIRLLNTVRTEAMVMGFTLWARALLLVLAPALGALSAAPPPSLDAGWARLAPWLLAVGWALGCAVAAPQIAGLVTAPSDAGRRARQALLAIELPLAIALTLSTPGWPAVVFAAGWVNWWVRIGPTTSIPDFSWTRAAIWTLVTFGAQVVGLALTLSGPVWPRAAGEAAITLGVVVLVADTYGAMLPVYIGVAARVLFTGARHQRQADADACAVLADVAAAIGRAADELDRIPGRSAVDDEARDILRRERERILATAPTPRRRGSRQLGAVVTAALEEGGHGLWTDDPRAIAASERARADGRVEPVAVRRPQFHSDDIGHLVLPPDVVSDLHQLISACIVEARVHGTRRVQTIVSRRADVIEVRIANPPNPSGSIGGGGHGGREIERLARGLPGARELTRGVTDRSFIDAAGRGVLFGVRFQFTVVDTHARGGQPGSTCGRL